VPEAFPGPPDLAVEVLSPSDRPARIHSKVAVYRSLLSPQRLGASDELDGFDVLPGFRLAVTRCFEL